MENVAQGKLLCLGATVTAVYATSIKLGPAPKNDTMSFLEVADAIRRTNQIAAWQSTLQLLSMDRMLFRSGDEGFSIVFQSSGPWVLSLLHLPLSELRSTRDTSTYSLSWYGENIGDRIAFRARLFGARNDGTHEIKYDPTVSNHLPYCPEFSSLISGGAGK